MTPSEHRREAIRYRALATMWYDHARAVRPDVRGSYLDLADEYAMTARAHEREVTLMEVEFG